MVATGNASHSGERSSYLVVSQERHRKKLGRLRKAAHLVEGCLAKRSWIAHSRFEPFEQPSRERPDCTECVSSETISYGRVDRYDTDTTGTMQITDISAMECRLYNRLYKKSYNHVQKWNTRC